MELLRSFLSSFGICRRPRPIALELSILAKLPPELIIRVAEFLSPVAAASFSLCCTPVYALISARYLKNGQNHQDFDTSEFFTLLERDLPDHITCWYCKKFHAIKHVKSHIDLHRSYRYYHDDPVPSCWNSGDATQIWLYVGSDFSITAFQMLMKRYRQGADCSSLLALLSENRRTLHYRDYNQKFISLSRIVDGTLLRRKQIVFLMHPPVDVPFPPYPGFVICPHFGYARREARGRIGGIIRRRLANWDKPDSCEAGGDLTQCQFCATEFRIDFKDFGEDGIAMFFTMWQNFGEGRCSRDHLLRSHISGKDGPTRKRVYFPAGSICAAFEGGENFEFDSLMNMKAVVNNPYRLWFQEQ